jgi:hypothetical protein
MFFSTHRFNMPLFFLGAISFIPYREVIAASNGTDMSRNNGYVYTRQMLQLFPATI